MVSTDKKIQKYATAIYQEYIDSGLTHEQAAQALNELDKKIYDKIGEEVYNALPREEQEEINNLDERTITAESVADRLGLTQEDTRNRVAAKLEDYITYLPNNIALLKIQFSKKK